MNPAHERQNADRETTSGRRVVKLGVIACVPARRPESSRFTGRVIGVDGGLADLEAVS